MLKIEENLFSILRKSLIFASLLSGLYFLVKGVIRPAFTGSVIGPQGADPYILLSFVLFLISMTVAHIHDLNFRKYLKRPRKILEE